MIAPRMTEPSRSASGWLQSLYEVVEVSLGLRQYVVAGINAVALLAHDGGVNDETRIARHDAVGVGSCLVSMALSCAWRDLDGEVAEHMSNLRHDVFRSCGVAQGCTNGFRSSHGTEWRPGRACAEHGALLRASNTHKVVTPDLHNAPEPTYSTTSSAPSVSSSARMLGDDTGG
jgi:hypothetical protein